MGEKREENDKKGEDCMVIDCIFAPATVERALQNAEFRQNLVELCFGYVNQKYSIECDPRFTIPKLKYKGSTVQYQRIKVKKTAKIQEVPITDQQRAEMERKGMEEQKMKEALAEKVPDWKIYCHMSAREEVMEADYWTRMIED